MATVVYGEPPSAGGYPPAGAGSAAGGVSSQYTSAQYGQAHNVGGGTGDWMTTASAAGLGIAVSN